MEKTLSICVAVYNIKEEFLRECIESIAADQSPDIEIILGDDCSENNSGRICMEYEKKDSRIKYICPQKNGGVSTMRNLMIQAAQGKWIVFADGDDAVVASYVKTLKEQASSACDIICFQWQRFSGELPKISDKDEKLTLIDPDACMEFSKACLTGAPPQLEKYGMENSTPSSVCNKAYRREFLTDSGLYFREGMKKAQDVEFNTRAFFCCKKLGYIPKIMYLYRTNPDSICNRYSRDYEKIAEDIMKYDMENLETLFGGDEELRKQWGNYKLLHLIIDNFGLNIFHQKNPKPSKQRRRDFLDFAGREPYKSFFAEFDFDAYHWNERKLILKLAARKQYGILNFMYTFPISFRIYGGLKNRLKIKARNENAK